MRREPHQIWQELGATHAAQEHLPVLVGYLRVPNVELVPISLTLKERLAQSVQLVGSPMPVHHNAQPARVERFLLVERHHALTVRGDFTLQQVHSNVLLVQ